jgi:hypothetical protein
METRQETAIASSINSIAPEPMKSFFPIVIRTAFLPGSGRNDGPCKSHRPGRSGYDA